MGKKLTVSQAFKNLSLAVQKLKHTVGEALSGLLPWERMERDLLIRPQSVIVYIDILGWTEEGDPIRTGDLFTLFFSSKGAGGTGLGLFIANKIAESHGGSLEIESEEGKGCKFLVTMPKRPLE